jgi:tetratricopeptide (TPR) repeat protein
MRLACGLLLLVAVTARAEPRALDPRARRELERGVAAFEEGRYDDAARAFEAGHKIDPHPAFYFPWAEAVRRSGDCERAVPLYQKALETAKTSASRRLVREPLRECEKIVARTTEAAKGEDRLAPKGESPAPPRTEPPAPSPPAPSPPRAAPPRAARPPPSPPAPSGERPFYLDPIGGALAGGAVVSLGLGITLFGLAEGNDSAAANEELLNDARRRWHAADNQRTLAKVATAAAIGFTVAAVLRYLSITDDGAGSGTDATQATLILDGDRALLTLGTTF